MNQYFTSLSSRQFVHTLRVSDGTDALKCSIAARFSGHQNIL
jgi:hypothetical protein